MTNDNDSHGQLARETRGLRVAVVHEWLSARAGSEQVFEAIAQLLPNADLFALSREPGLTLASDPREVAVTALNNGLLRGRRSLTLPLMPLAWRSMSRNGSYDLVITSHHAFAHTNRLASREGRHLAYVHSPARYVWTPDLDQRGGSSLLAPARSLLKRVDRSAASRLHSIASNSSTVAHRVRDFWGRDSRVIPPPVRTQFFTPQPSHSRCDYILGVGRWIGYKRMDLVIRVAELCRTRAVLAGRGPARERLQALAASASVPVELIESPSDETLRELYRSARCLVFPTIEDFGIVPVEAQACGTPVVGPNAGGLRDTVINGETGALAESLNPETLAASVQLTESISSAACVHNAQRFSPEAFRRRMTNWLLHSLDPAK